jgi:hypothetical protein
MLIASQVEGFAALPAAAQVQAPDQAFERIQRAKRSQIRALCRRGADPVRQVAQGYIELELDHGGARQRASPARRAAVNDDHVMAVLSEFAAKAPLIPAPMTATSHFSCARRAR